MTRHKMHCPQKFALVQFFFSNFLFPATPNETSFVSHGLDSHNTCGSIANRQQLYNMPVKRNKHCLYFHIRFRLRLRFQFRLHFYSISCEVMLGLGLGLGVGMPQPRTCPFFCIILINYITFYHFAQLSRTLRWGPWSVWVESR